MPYFTFFSTDASRSVRAHESGDTQLCNIVDSTAERLTPGFYHFEELFDVAESVDSERSIIGDGKGTGVLLCIVVLPAQAGTSPWTAVEAASQFQQQLLSKKSSCTSFMYSILSRKGESASTYLVSSLPLDSREASSAALSCTGNFTLELLGQGPRFRQGLFRKSTTGMERLADMRVLALVATSALALLIVSVLGARLILHQPGNSAWQRYDVKGSVGPRYQLQFSYSNVTGWAKLHSHTNEKWFLRIDDQAMIPAALVDEEELHYQAWYQARYPEMNAIRLNQTYLDEEFLGDPEAIQVPADTTFHMSHCVRAVRRYWQAKETGRHVCARDIDYQHVKHCLDALDMWAFPEGPRGSVGEMTSNKMLPEDTTRLVWKTKVCFDE
jgi:hypothetical protein